MTKDERGVKTITKFPIIAPKTILRKIIKNFKIWWNNNILHFTFIKYLNDKDITNSIEELKKTYKELSKISNFDDATEKNLKEKNPN